MQRLEASTNRRRTAAALAAELDTRGLSAGRLLNLFYTWSSGTAALPPRDLRHLINLSRAGSEITGNIRQRASIPRETVEAFISLELENQRGSREAYRVLVRRYRAGEPIPGVPPGTDRRSLPAGWSYGNFMRRARALRGAWDLTAARIGRQAASEHTPKIFTTRVGLHAGEAIMFDDMWHDFEVVDVGQRKPMRLLQLSALDVYSGCQFARGLKPRLEDPETGKRTNLKEGEMLFLTTHVLETYGWYRGGCTLLVELGTAALDEALERLLYDLTNGAVKVQRSGVRRGSAVPGLFDAEGSGNYRFKAHIESWHNLAHNATANILDFPGQVGANSRLSRPEEIELRSRYSQSLIKILAGLPPDIIRAMRLGYLQLDAACDMIHEVSERLNQRTDHVLEGWKAAGLTTVDYEIPGVGTLPASAVLALEPAKRQAVLAAATPVARNLSPREVYDAGAADRVRLTTEQAATILCSRHGREVKVDCGLIEFEDRAIAPGVLRFRGFPHPDGAKFRAVVNPFSLNTIHLFDAAGRWCGACDAWSAASRTDTEAVHRAIGKAAHIERLERERTAGRATRIAKARLDMHTTNARLLADAADREADLMAEANASLSKMF